MTLFVSQSGRVLAAVIVVVLVFAEVADLSTHGLGSESWRGLALTVFIGAAAWATLWQPRLIFTDTVLDVRNVARRHIIEWGAIKRIDTKWGLTLVLDKTRVTAWAAPAPGRHAAMTATRDRGAHLPESTYSAGTIRPGDLVTTDSGGAASLARRVWEKRTSNEGASSVRLNTPVVLILAITAVPAVLAVVL